MAIVCSMWLEVVLVLHRFMNNARFQPRCQRRNVRGTIKLTFACLHPGTSPVHPQTSQPHDGISTLPALKSHAKNYFSNVTFKMNLPLREENYTPYQLQNQPANQHRPWWASSNLWSSWSKGRAGTSTRSRRHQSRGDALHLVPQSFAAAGAKAENEEGRGSTCWSYVGGVVSFKILSRYYQDIIKI